MIRGHCLCGRVAYELRGEPREMYYCHCSMCRRATGSTFATNMLALARDFVIVAGRAHLKAYESSPGEHRHFCAECGSPVYGEALARPGLVSIRCGTVDGDPGARPASHLHTASMAPWFAIRDEVRQFPGEPT